MRLVFEVCVMSSAAQSSPTRPDPIPQRPAGGGPTGLAARWSLGVGGAGRSDLIAGFTTAVMLVPQAMAYAILAGLPPIFGLYASTLPLIAYAALGRSAALSVGPVAMDSMLVATTVGALAAAGSADYFTLAIGLAAMMGAIQLALGLFRAGSVANFLSVPVLSGFTSAAAIIIATSQVSALLGVKGASAGSGFGQMLWSLAQNVPSAHWLTAGLGGAAVAGLLALKRWAPRAPAALVVVGVGSVLVWALGLSEAGVRVVGSIPAGLPSFTLEGFCGVVVVVHGFGAVAWGGDAGAGGVCGGVLGGQGAAT